VRSEIAIQNKGVKANIKIDNNIGLITLQENVYGVAKGQFAVFYDGDKLLGGGEIIDVLG